MSAERPTWEDVLVQIEALAERVTMLEHRAAPVPDLTAIRLWSDAARIAFVQQILAELDTGLSTGSPPPDAIVSAGWQAAAAKALAEMKR